MLRKIRIVLAAMFFIGITLLFLDFTGTLHAWLGWMAKVQFLPALMASNAVIVCILLLLTVLFGRVYCSVICPLGVMQDIISWINGSRKKKYRFRFRYTPARNWLRYGMLALFIILLAFGVHSLALLIAPYSAYGRIAANLLAPLYQWGNNCLAWIAERFDSYAFYSTEVWLKSASSLAVALITLGVTGLIAWKGGRTWCNTVCPVGTILGFFSRRSIFAPVIDTKKCRDCGLCGRQCKASCINMEKHEIDYSRCVACMDCLDTCKEGAIRYESRYGRLSRRDSVTSVDQPATTGEEKQSQTEDGIDQGRRAFLISGAIATTAVAANAQEMKTDGGHADVSYAKVPQRNTPLVPAGAQSLKNFTDRCTACQLCVSVCPNDVLRPSTSLMNLMQPEMSYERGWCRPECTRCSDICPSGAILPLSVEEKSSTQIGYAVVNLDLCVVNTDEVACGNCARHCPSGAIRMVKKDPDNPDSLLVPAVRRGRCIGCGACENLCPARPVTAIHVEGREVHKTY